MGFQKIDYNGNIIYTKQVGYFYDHDRGDMILHSSGDFILVNRDHSQFSSGNIRIIRIDSEGAEIFNQVINVSGFNHELAQYEVAESSDQNIIIMISNYDYTSNSFQNKKNGVIKVDINDGTKLLP